MLAWYRITSPNSIQPASLSERGRFTAVRRLSAIICGIPRQRPPVQPLAHSGTGNGSRENRELIRRQRDTDTVRVSA